MALQVSSAGPFTPRVPASDLQDPPGVAALLRASSSGDEAAFEQLYDAVCGQVYGIVLSVVGDTTSAEEVSRDSFVEAWRTSARFDEAHSTAVSWVIAIANRRAVDWVRLADVHHVPSEGWSRAPSGAWSSDGTTPASPSAEAVRVRAAFLTLAHDDRTVVELAFLRGFSQAQLAGVLLIPLDLVRARIAEGLGRLRTMLEAAR